jgi:hypothetical protein
VPASAPHNAVAQFESQAVHVSAVVTQSTRGERKAPMQRWTQRWPAPQYAHASQPCPSPQLNELPNESQVWGVPVQLLPFTVQP